MVKLDIKFKFEKETPGAVRFQEVDEDGNTKSLADGATVGTLYIRKTALGGVKPSTLEVTIKGDVKG